VLKLQHTEDGSTCIYLCLLILQVYVVVNMISIYRIHIVVLFSRSNLNQKRIGDYEDQTPEVYLSIYNKHGEITEHCSNEGISTNPGV
jgi:hypothetical protein